MSRRVVYVVCAEGEEKLAEQLANPLQEAGYEVAHNGKIAIGDSLVGEAEKAVTSGLPIILCATAKAIGSAWAHRIINAAHAGGLVRVFVVQMERQAYVDQLALDGKIARYCDDPVQAVKDLLDALAKHFPSKPAGPSEASAATDLQFLDHPTELTTFDIDAVNKFRAELRDEVAARYPANLSAWEFLTRAGLWAEGRLTRTGALLFAKDPATVCPTSMVKCVQYFGTDRAAVRKIDTFEGTVGDQIIYADDFVRKRVVKGEAPSADQAQSAVVYDYPMKAVREIIANALVHRDYRSSDACTHLRLFADRLEVSSPGSWLGRDLRSGAEYQIASLSGQSVKRNFRLAHDLSWIRLVEGEGTGIPSALKDCEATRSPVPVVVQDNGFVTVTLRPCGQLKDQNGGTHRATADSDRTSTDSRSGLKQPGVGSSSPTPAIGLIRQTGLWGHPTTPRNTSRDIICVECPNIYSEYEIIATRGDESRPLVEVLGQTRSDIQNDASRPLRRTVRRLFGRESHLDGTDTPKTDADTSIARRDNLRNLNRLKDWTFTCPNGHTVDGNRGYQIPLAVVGASASGKSHFLSGLIWETNLLRALSPLGLTLRLGQFTSSRLSYSMRQLYEEQKILPPTPSTEVAGPFGYRLTIREKEEDSRYSLLLFDVAGEALSSIARIGEQATFVLLAQGLIVLIDPQHVVTTLFDETDVDVVERERVIAAAEVRDSIRLVADALEELWDNSSREIPIPMCFVVAKADSICWTYHWEAETAKVLEEVRGGRDLRQSLLESSHRVKEAFSDYGGGLIVEEIEERFSMNRVRFVAASATCEMPTTDGWENPTPTGISLALLHVLDMLGRIRVNAADGTDATDVRTNADESPDTL